MTQNKSEVTVTFYPQEWTDSSGQAHDWDRKQLIPAEGREPVTFVVPREDVTDENGDVYPDESYEANQLQAHADAPDWVREWDGPYYVTTEPDTETEG